MQKIIGVKRTGDKSLYFFLPNDNYNVGDRVVVQFDDFLTVATVALVKEEEDSKAYELSKVKHKATESDLKTFDELSKKAKEILPKIKQKSLELGLMMKFVSAEYSLDNSKILIVFSSEERVDFRQLLKDLASMLKVRIELKQIGQRDEVKICGGVGQCGQQCCCARFLKDFEHVTVKMAKIQGLSLSPTKINGVCGRLLCCLGYETDTYEEILSRMPKINDEAISSNGKGTVVYNDILRERVSIKRQDGDSFVVEDYALDEIVFGDKIKEYYAHPERFNLKKKEEQTKAVKNDEKTDDRKVENNAISENSEDKDDKSINSQDEKFNHKKHNGNWNNKPNNFAENKKNSEVENHKYGMTIVSDDDTIAEKVESNDSNDAKTANSGEKNNFNNKKKGKYFKKPYNKNKHNK